MTTRSRCRFLFFAMCALVSSGAEASADTWASHGTRVSVSRSGSYYLVVDGSAFDGMFCGPADAELHLVRRAPGRAPVEPASIRTDALPEGGARGLVEAGDELVWTVTGQRIPLTTHVLDDGRVVLVDIWGATGWGNLVTVFGTDGRRAFRLPPGDVFEGFLDRGFWQTVSSISWERAQWIDEEADALVLVARDDAVRTVDLATGAVGAPALDDVLFAPSGPESEQERCAAWEVAWDVEVPGAVAHAARLVAEGDAPESVLVRAATVLGREAPDVARPVLLAGIRSADDAASTWAWRHLGEVLGAEAVPLYRDAMARAVVWRSSHLTEGIACAGGAALLPVLEMVVETGDDHRSQLAYNAWSLIEGSFARTGVVVDRPLWKEDEDAFEALRDRCDVSGVGELLRAKEMSLFWPEPRYSHLALPTLELLRRCPVSGVLDELETFRDRLRDDPHQDPVWDALLTDAVSAAIAATR